jgi:DNA-binding transcriptional MerR regulator
MTVTNLVDMAYQQLATLPPPPNGQVRQLPGDRAVRYYTSLGLIDRPTMRGRTAIYGRRHLAQLVAIKRLQQVGKSLADIQALWSSVDENMLGRISGIPLDGSPLGMSRALRDLLFWKTVPVPLAEGEIPKLPPSPLPAPVELRVDLAPGVTLVLTSAARQRLLSALETTRNEEP